MNQPDLHVREHLSAGIDGELSHEELRFLLRRLDHDVELQQAWTSYHMARDGLRRQMPPLASTGFAARVMLAIEQQDIVAVAVAAPRQHRWLRWSAGGAIAASVAAAALMVSQPAGDRSERHAAPLAAQASAGTRVRSAPAAAAQPVPEVAVVPQWLSGKAPGLLSQRASATLGAPGNADFSPYARGLSSFRAQRYRTLDNHDGSYLILLDPAQQQVPDAPRQGAASAQ